MGYLRLVLVGLASAFAVLHLPAAPLFGSSGEETDTGSVNVDVVVDMTEAGKKIDRPTPGNPVYYLPLPAGWETIGYAPYFQRPPPTRAEVETFIEKVFAEQGYRVLVHHSHPTLVLELAWGYIAPTNEFDRAAASGVPPGWMHSLIWGDTDVGDKDTVDFNGKPRNYRTIDNLKQMGGHGRYYVIVSAFDFQAWLHHNATLLWRAHISTEIWGHYFDQVLPAMITTAAPQLGRETLSPDIVTIPNVPTGHVTVGTPVLKGDQSPPAVP